MGSVTRGISHKLVRRIQKEHGVQDFVETGTYYGKSAAWACREFDQVYTVEISDKFYDISGKALSGYSNCHRYHMDSLEGLSKILAEKDGKAPTLFWLDAHWSPDLGYSEPEVVCPIFDELTLVSSFNGLIVVMIDDARMFGREFGWPSIVDLFAHLEFVFGECAPYVEDDVIIAYRESLWR